MFKKWFTKKAPALPPIDFSRFEVDMHSHLIPGIDDGSRSMDESIAMLAKFESMGYRKVITTPHIMSDYFRNTPEIILGGLEKVRETATQLGLKIEIEAAAEYYFDDALMRKLKDKEKLLTFGNNHVLVEFSFHDKPDQIETLFFELITQNYKPILAHFERYPYFFEKLEVAKELRDRGVLIQVNFNSIVGHYGPGIKAQAERLIDVGLVDLVASDCHRMSHLMIMEKGAELPYVHKALELPLINKSL